MQSGDGTSPNSTRFVWRKGQFALGSFNGWGTLFTMRGNHMEGAVGSQPIATSARKQNNGTTVASRCGTSVYKRAFDILVSGSLLVFGAPLLILIALGIKLQDGAPLSGR